jgi:hypothetical protein
VRDAYLAIVNPAAGGGRTHKLLAPALDRLRASGLQIEIRENRSNTSFYLSSDRAPAIPNAKNGSPIQFSMITDAGELRFTGEVQRDIASGRYHFEPNKTFATEAGKLLKRELTNDEAMTKFE